MQTATPLPSIQALMTPGADLGLDGHPVYGYMGFLEDALRFGQSRQLLIEKASAQRSKRLEQAMNDGVYALQKSVELYVFQVMRSGQLLLCWPGTTVLRGAV